MKINYILLGIASIIVIIVMSAKKATKKEGLGEGEVKCRFTVDNVVDEVKYNGKKINYTGNSRVWSEAKKFSFTPVPGGVLEIKGHETSRVAGCKNSGLQL